MNAKPIHLSHVSHDFGSVRVLDDVTLTVRSGEFVAVVGPSGCGKSTLLNLISRYEQPSSGTVETIGAIRQVYQQDSLFPWLTVADNIRLGMRSVSPEAREQQLFELLTLIGQQDFAEHYPHQLSGGMRQRVELARALAGHADILLMDEPFSALDYQARLRMRRELVRLLQSCPCTVVFVTHDLEEAAQLADRIIVLSERPSRIQCELAIELPRPRDVTHPLVVDAVSQMLSELGLREDQTAACSIDSKHNL
ncbi:ABC transporter ATP-binding protein [Capsulimonas corticalis]|uniref:ABC transporter ATP-binding protein n=1 Tax=Capsulimonas corticalis TaxID=2219043 RepID=A0A402D6Q9_9BACT|nr:ABC transporter ATP-binding protein [Capsulimonas corticalis]BDI29340.1 ABC transporter ATP-binding protein [Capsulimonas corticalis]